MGHLLPPTTPHQPPQTALMSPQIRGTTTVSGAAFAVCSHRLESGEVTLLNSLALTTARGHDAVRQGQLQDGRGSVSLCLVLPLPSRLRHRLCLALPLPSWVNAPPSPCAPTRLRAQRPPIFRAAPQGSGTVRRIAVHAANIDCPPTEMALFASVLRFPRAVHAANIDCPPTRTALIASVLRLPQGAGCRAAEDEAGRADDGRRGRRGRRRGRR